MDLSKNTNFSFYDVQMRKRLWLTICVLDMQTALAQASLPLVSADEVTASIASVRHINDSDFGPDTVHDIPDREGLTDITFALVKFHLQIMGRNIGAGRGMPSSTSSSQSDWEMLQHHAHKFEKSVLGLLHFCDPEASPYAWFTWHSTQLFVSGARLAALRPLYRTKWSAKNIPPRMRNDSELLELTTRALEKMELMHTDRRADDFRWMVTIQWHILAIAIAECYISSDRMLVRRAWIVIESLYQRHESFMTKNTGGSLQGPLGKLMRRTRDKIRVVLGDSLPENSQQATKFVATSTCLDPTATTVHRLESSESTPGSFVNLPTPLLREDIAFIPSTPPIPDADPWDQSWKLWEDFMCDISFDKLESSDGFI